MQTEEGSCGSDLTVRCGCGGGWKTEQRGIRQGWVREGDTYAVVVILDLDGAIVVGMIAVGEGRL